MKKIKTVRINNLFIFIIVFIFLCIIGRLIYVSTDQIMVNGEKLSVFANKRDTVKKIIPSTRGTIYSAGGDVLAKDVNSYTVIAYLSDSRTKDPAHPYHVVDKQMTAEKLSPLINMSPERILSLLNTTIERCDDKGECKQVPPYQVELGPGGRGITELTKGQIDDLDLPGIDFLYSTKRYYPNGDFLSYTLGYVKKDDNNNAFGEMGVELYYDDELSGENGYIEYQSDIQGYQITNTPSVEKLAVPGNDVYLTIDNNIQMFTEQAITTLETSSLEWAMMVVANAKTGEILGLAASPSFNNNTLEIKSYYDPFVSYTYEPGSTMKIFSFLGAMENGIYDGNAKYKSGKLKVDDATIKDWNNYGWGEITYNQGFMGSSNVAASKLALTMGRAKLKDFYNKLGFGTKTGISLPNEQEGIVNFKYNTEVASASFGQGMTVTGAQMVQALTLLGNEGTVLRPYIVSKIVDGETGEVLLENKRTEVAKVASKENTDQIISLMRGVVDGSAKMSTGTGYYIAGYDLIGKTGTAEIASSSGGYLKGGSNYIRSFAGAFPGNDPQIIVYAASSKLAKSGTLKTAVKDLVRNVGTYLNIYGDYVDNTQSVCHIDSYISKNTQTVRESLTSQGMNVIVLGEGEKIISQYPSKGTTLNIGNKVFLLTNGSEYKIPNIIGWSRGDVTSLAKILNINATFTGFGYVTSTSIPEGTVVSSGLSIDCTLEKKYKSEEELKKEKEEQEKLKKEQEKSKKKR